MKILKNLLENDNCIRTEKDFPIKGNLISDKVESQILDKLCIFEQNKGFLNPNITIAILGQVKWLI